MALCRPAQALNVGHGKKSCYTPWYQKLAVAGVVREDSASDWADWMIGSPALNYHEEELRIALCPTDLRHYLPPIHPEYTTVLDVGCGIGQSLIALRLPREVTAYGIDCDDAAVEEGSKRVPPNVKLIGSAGESLPFDSSTFDFVMSRVALPYMEIDKALSEMARVMKPGATIWISLHPISKTIDQMGRSFLRKDWEDIIFCCYVLCNTILFNYFGKQFRFRGRMESCQTAGGIRRAFKRARLNCTTIAHDRFFIVTGIKG
jgi:SAM-dependent methyltransferase